MSRAAAIKNTDAVILCGGKGRRLRPLVHDRPKVLAKIGDKVFLDIIIRYLKRAGFRRIILCTGYMGNLIREHYARKKKMKGEILFSHEPSPLGTGGGLRHARKLVESDPFLVLNGDSFCKIDFRAFLRVHKALGAEFSLALARTTKPHDYGSVRLNRDGEITAFQEKNAGKASPFVNAGVYLFSRRVFTLIPVKKKVSLERDLFPRLIGRGFFGYKIRGSILDIGTPERYRSAAGILKRRLGTQ